jgi:exodeoxyribonuclease VII large subunit
MLNQTRKIYSVAELNGYVRDLIRSHFRGYVWVCGEIQDLRQRQHINLSLVQKHASKDQLIAKVSAVIFANIVPKIKARLRAIDPEFNLKNDIEVKLLCKVDLYAKIGKFSLTVFDLDPSYTLGKVAQNRQKIINELKQKGLLEKNKARPIPPLPLNIGLITARDSAAYADFINELQASGFGFRVFAFDAHVQGRMVEADITRGLKLFNKCSAESLDLILIIRGGGSTADLSYFDNKLIATQIARSKFPVVTALGHQINVTVADLVAHTTLKTPTKAGQFLVECLQNESTHLEESTQAIIDKALYLVTNNKQSLESKTLYLQAAVNRYFRVHREQLVHKRAAIVAAIDHIIKTNYYQLQLMQENIVRESKIALSRAKEYINNCYQKIKLVDPAKVLQRGYAIVSKGGRAIKAASELKLGDEVENIFYQGRANSKVTKINNHKEDANG